MEKDFNIKVIEEPESDILANEELAEALGGWNCGSYTKYTWFKSSCYEWNSGHCTEEGKRNYCGEYSKNGKKQ